MQKKVEKIYFSVLLVLVIIQPILDIMWLNDGTIPEILGFTVPTIVRMMLVAVLAILSFVVIKFNRKYLWFILYAGLIGVYFIAHHYSCTKFQSLVPGNFNYSMVGEAFYIVRMCIPLAIVYFSYNSKLNEKTFNKSIITISLLMSSSAIITNIMKIAFGSYTSEHIAGNIFDWFMNHAAFTSNQLSSKGIFYSSITSTVMVMLYPYLLYLFLARKKIGYFVVAVMQGIALFMFGTKATTFSVIIVSVIMAAVYLFCGIIKKDYALSKIAVLGLILIIAGNFVIYSVSPALIKMDFDKEYAAERDEDTEYQKEYDLSDEKKQEIIEFFDNNYHYVSIKEDFLLESYPYKYDPIFWYRFCDEHVPSQRMQNRIVEEKILQRVKEVNSNSLDKWLGIGYTRTSNIYNLEKDFVYQYYSMGILGAGLLVGPYVIFILIMIIIMLWKFKKKCTLENCSIVLGVGLTCCLAFYSGNTLENLGITIILGFVIGYAWKRNFQKESMVDPDEK